MELIDFYKILYLETKEENKYIKENEEVDDKIINSFVMQKKISVDRIEKFKSKFNLVYTEEQKLLIKNIINDIIELEKENEIIYKEKLIKIKEKLNSLVNERKLNSKYITGITKGNIVDEKE